MKNNKSEPIPVMDYRQYRRVRRLVHECCNYIDGNCIALDDGEECVCVQSISYSLLCRWFRTAVLPQDKELETALFHRLNAKKCAVCGALFTPGSNRANMAYVPVPKDLTKVKTKVMFNLTRRQLVCFTAGALVGVPLFLWLREPAGNSMAAMCMMLVMMPFFLLAMYEKHGQPLEKIVGNILKVAVIRPKQRPYQTNNFYAVLKRQEMLDKEVYDIVHRNKKMAASDVRKNRGKNCAAGKDKEKAVPRR